MRRGRGEDKETVTLQAVGTRCIAVRVRREEGLIVIPDTAIDSLRSQEADVVSVGHEVTEYSVGDRVVVNAYCREFKLDNKEYLVLDPEDIYAKVVQEGGE